jgi:hypothetical protein
MSRLPAEISSPPNTFGFPRIPRSSFAWILMRQWNELSCDCSLHGRHVTCCRHRSASSWVHRCCPTTRHAPPPSPPDLASALSPLGPHARRSRKNFMARQFSCGHVRSPNLSFAAACEAHANSHAAQPPLPRCTRRFQSVPHASTANKPAPSVFHLLPTATQASAAEQANPIRRHRSLQP